jgi:hypothetical protein
MVLKQRKTTRWTARVGGAVVSFVLEILKSFLNFKKEDGLLTRGKKTANLIVRRVVYFAADYGLTFVSAAIVASMKAMGFSFLSAFIAMWIFDFVVAGAFIVFYEKTGEDLSLGEDLRRATDTIHKTSRLAGYAAMLFIIGQAIVWTGPEKIITFFRKEIGTIPRVALILLILTAIQAVIWTMIYGFGYDLLVRWF